MKYVSGPHYIYKRDDLKVGEPTPWHGHSFPHNTVVINGRARVELDGWSRDVSSSDEEPWVLVPAGVHHRVTKLTEEAQVCCFFSHFNPETGEPVDAFKYRNERAYK